MDKLERQRLASRVAQDIPEGAYVNLGVGLPTLIADYIPPDREVILHSENGILGRWVKARPGHEDSDLINAGKEPIEMLKGGALFGHPESFGMMRGGHLDICVLGAFQVSARGDLANWHTGEKDAVPAVGGAMDLAVGAKSVYVIMDHVDKDGRPKILSTCTFPLTGQCCVSRIYSNYAVIDVTASGLRVRELSEGVTRDKLVACTDAPLIFEGNLT